MLIVQKQTKNYEYDVIPFCTQAVMLGNVSTLIMSVVLKYIETNINNFPEYFVKSSFFETFEKFDSLYIVSQQIHHAQNCFRCFNGASVSASLFAETLTSKVQQVFILIKICVEIKVFHSFFSSHQYVDIKEDIAVYSNWWYTIKTLIRNFQIFLYICWYSASFCILYSSIHSVAMEILRLFSSQPFDSSFPHYASVNLNLLNKL